MCESKCEDSRQIEDKEVFAGSSRVSFPQSEAYAQHMTGMQRFMTDADNWFSWVSHR